MICEIKNPDKAPPGGWYFDIEGARIEGYTYRALLTNVSAALRDRGEPVPADIVNQVNCQVCARSPLRYCVQESEGLGDTVAKVTRVTGIQRVVRAAVGGGCTGCGKRQNRWNKAVPYKKRNLR